MGKRPGMLVNIYNDRNKDLAPNVNSTMVKKPGFILLNLRVCFVILLEDKSSNSSAYGIGGLCSLKEVMQLSYSTVPGTFPAYSMFSVWRSPESY
jgi:hypothetical protein